MREIIFISILCGMLNFVACQKKVTDYPIQPVNFTQVHLADSFWSPKLSINREVSIPTAFHQCEINGRLDNFALAAGLKTGEHQGDFPFDDTDIYKVVEGASYVLAVQYDPQLDHYLDSVIHLIAAAQEPDGYLYTCRTNRCDRLQRWMGSRRWEKVNSHELYNCGHLYEAATAHYYATGKRHLLDVAIKNADLVCQVFGTDSGQIHQPSGHPIVEMGLVKMYRVTGNPKYLEKAKYFCEEAGRLSDGRPASPYSQDHKPIKEQDEAVGHAVRFGYLYSGVADVAALCQDQGFIEASKRLWNNITDRKLYITGGIGARAWGEGFGENYELPNMTSYCETCASISNVYWNYRLFLLTGESKYYDVLERALYNGVISGVSLDGKRYFYDNPLMSDGSHDRSEWFGCSCCPSNITRFMPSIPGYVYAVRGNTLFVNLYIGNEGQMTLDGQSVRIKQETRYPWEGRIKLTLDHSPASSFALALRIPGWVQQQPLPGTLYTYLDKDTTSYTISLNGKTVKPEVRNGYALLRGDWKGNDQIVLNLPMQVRKVIADPQVIDDRNKYALIYGPIVYCVEASDHDGYALDLFTEEDTPFSPEFKPDLLHGVMTLKGQGYHLLSDGHTTLPTSVTAIPYYAWDNRGANEMNVWIPYTREASIPRRTETLASQAQASVSIPYGGYGLNDRFEPRNSADKSMQFHNWWQCFGTEEWAQYEWDQPMTLTEASVYWLELGHYDIDFQLPVSWRLEYKAGEKWLPVKNTDPYEIAKDKYCTVHFQPVRTKALRLTAQLQEGKSAGILEWKVR